MATAEAEIEGGVPAEAKKGGKGKLLIMVGGVVAVLLIGAALYLFVLAPKAPDAAGGHGEEAAGEHGEAGAHPESFIFNLPAMTINLAPEATGGPSQFMKLTIALEVGSEEVMHEIQPRLAKVIDAFQVYLRELRRSDLEGSAGIYRLKEELRRRVNVAVFPAQVDSILFKEILIQ
jgi:flagellar protein FliL